MVSFIADVDRDKTTPFPERLEDWIAEDHHVRVIDLLVDDLRGMGFGRGVPARTGRPGYHQHRALLRRLHPSQRDQDDG